MDELTRWIVGGLVATLLGLIGVIWSQLHRRLDAEVKVIWDQIGRDSESGMRKTVHRSANEITRISGEQDDHGRRIGYLERRLFNGHRRIEQDEE